MSSLTEAEDDDPDHKLPSAVEKLGHNYRGKSFKQLSKNSSFTLPSGVTMLSSIDSEALEGVDDPHVRADRAHSHTAQQPTAFHGPLRS